MKRLVRMPGSPVLLLCLVVLGFFWMVYLKGLIPFPGDLLLTQYAPWRHTSYEGYVAGAIPSKDQYFDVVRELYPWKTLVTHQLKSGQLPLWNPYNFSGAPLLANYQSQVLYPLSLLYLVLPQVTAWTVMVISQPVLGSVFMYLFAAEIGLSAGASVLAALLFNFSSFANVWMEFTTVWHTVLWLPLLLYLVERGLKQGRLTVWQQIIFIFALFSSITGGHPQDFINTFLFFVVYALSRIGMHKGWNIRQKIVFILNPLAIITLIPFGLAAPQLLSTIELFRNSARVTHDYTYILSNLIVQAWQLPLVAVQDFFGNPATKSNIFGDYVLKTVSVGITGFTFALISIRALKKSWYKMFFLITAIVILLLTVRNPVSEVFFRYPLPLLSTGTPTRILFVFLFAVSMLAGFGFNEIFTKKRFPLKAVLLTWGVICVLWVIVILHPTIGATILTPAHISTMRRSMILATLILGALTSIIFVSRYKKAVLLLVIPVCIGELYLAFVKFNPFVPPEFVFPQNKIISFLKSQSGIDRFWGYGTAQIEANFATQDRIFSTDGTDPLNLAWYNRFIHSGADGNLPVTFTRSTRSDAYLLPGYGKTDLPDNLYRLRIMDVLGVKYVLDRTENPKNDSTFAPERFKEVWHQDDGIIYENLVAAPRIYATSDVRPYSGDADFEKQFFSDTFTPGGTVLVESVDYAKLPKFASGSSQISLVSYSPNQILLQTITESQQFLYLSDTYDNGWTAKVNGKSVVVYKANYAFRGVLLPEGESAVSFTYEPKSFSNGVYAAAVAFVGALIYFILLKVKGKGR